LEKRSEQQTRSESKMQLVEQIKICNTSGDYSRALDLLRSAAGVFPNDAELLELEKIARDGVKRKAEADSLITESQELFAQQKSAEAIQLLRKAYELDKRNSLARAILANALVEHAHSILETDWLEAETLTNQALALNPAHPTAQTIRNQIVEQKRTSSVEDWVVQARKLQSSGDLFKALAWVAEGLAVHPDDPKLAQIQDAIQRDQGARRRQARREDLKELRRMEVEINGAADGAAKQALAERIQAMAAKYWTDGEILSVANILLQRLGLASNESSSASPQNRGAAVIFHVPRPAVATPASTGASAMPSSPVPTEAPGIIRVPPTQVPPAQVPAKPIATASVPAGTVAQSTISPSNAPAIRTTTTAAEPALSPAPAASVATAVRSAPAGKITSHLSGPKRPTSSGSRILMLVSAAAIMLVAAIMFFARRHSPAAKTPTGAPTVLAPAVSQALPAPVASAPTVSPPAETSAETPGPDLGRPSDAATGKVAIDDQEASESGRNVGTLVVIAGQDDARVFLNGKLQRQVTRSGELRIPGLELKDYVVQVSKSGFQDPAQQTVRIRKGENAKLIFTLQPQPRMASLTIQGGAPGTTVLIDQVVVGNIQSDGALSVSSINSGDHTIELRKERCKPRQFKKHFVVGGMVSLAAADTALEALPGELKITFTPPDAKVAIVKGDLLKIVSSGVPLNVAPGTYTLTARTADRVTRSSTLEVIAGQSKALNLSLAPSSMSQWDDPGAWKHEKDFFVRKGGDFVLYGVVPVSGTFDFSAMPAKGHRLQWVLNYSDAKNYVLFQMDDDNFYRSVIRNGQTTDVIKIPDRNDKRSFRTFHIQVSPTEIVHQIRHGDSWNVLDRWTQSGGDLSRGKFGFYIPGSDQVALSSFAHYADLNIR
jgi:Flp pilus assembly protein TadD